MNKSPTSIATRGEGFILPAPRTLRSKIDVLYYIIDTPNSRSALVQALSSKNAQVAKLEAEKLSEGGFRIVCAREGSYVTITFVVTRGQSVIDGQIDGKQFRIDGCSTSSVGITFTDEQRKVMQPWNEMHDHFIGFGEAATVRSNRSLGCIAAAVGTGVATFACLDGALPGCVAGLFGVAYLADHCI